jgi:hypothetical protein
MALTQYNVFVTYKFFYGETYRFAAYAKIGASTSPPSNPSKVSCKNDRKLFNGPDIFVSVPLLFSAMSQFFSTLKKCMRMGGGGEAKPALLCTVFGIILQFSTYQKVPVFRKKGRLADEKGSINFLYKGEGRGRGGIGASLKTGSFIY